LWGKLKQNGSRLNVIQPQWAVGFSPAGSFCLIPPDQAI
jgi:hypothetical protein